MTNINNLPDLLSGPALTLRRLVNSDAPNFARMMQEADVACMTRTIPRHLPLIAAEGKIMEMRAQDRRGLSFSYAITESASGTFIGVIVLFRKDTDNMLEIDYHIAKPSWNEAYAMAACQLMIDAAQTYLGVRCIKADVFVDNAQSLRALKLLGFNTSGPVTHSFSMFRLEKVPTVTLRLDLNALASHQVANESKRQKAQLYLV